MKPAEKVSICKKHQQPFMYQGEECPWCQFAKEVIEKLQTEYKRGFEDGVKAADAEYAKQAAAAQAAKVPPKKESK